MADHTPMPRPDDMHRSLAADLDFAEKWAVYGCAADSRVPAMLLAALRRALAAEDHGDNMRDVVHALEMENRHLREALAKAKGQPCPP